MNQIQLTPEQIGLLKEAATHVDNLFSILNMFEGTHEGLNAADRFEEAFGWMQKSIANGKIKSKQEDLIVNDDSIACH